MKKYPPETDTFDRQALIRALWGDSPPKDFAAMLDYFADPVKIAEASKLLPYSPRLYQQVQEMVKEAIRQAATAADNGQFDEFIFPRKLIWDMSLWIEKKIDPLPAPPDVKVFFACLVEAYHKFAETAIAQLQARIHRKLEVTREPVAYILYLGAETSFQLPLADNIFLTALFQRSAKIWAEIIDAEMAKR